MQELRKVQRIEEISAWRFSSIVLPALESQRPDACRQELEPLSVLGNLLQLRGPIGRQECGREERRTRNLIFGAYRQIKVCTR